jgi:hypothetical protein
MRSKDQILLEGLYEGVRLGEAFDSSMGTTRPIDSQKLVDYINRVVEKKRVKKVDPKTQKQDYLHMPHIHASIAQRVLVQTPSGETVDLDAFKNILTKRPEELLRQNAKMKKSSTEDTVFYNTTLPALKGLVIDEDTGEFKIVDTCPSAGACQLVCYAKHGSYTLFPEVSMFQNRTLNYLFNDPESFQGQLEAEIKLAAVKHRNKRVQIRWNDSGDLLSPKFFNIVMDIVKNTPMVDHYIYTKEVEMTKAFPNPPENVIFNFSYGARKEQEKLIDPKKDKVSYIVNVEDKVKEPELYAITRFKYIEIGDDKKWKYNNVDATKSIISQKYNIDPKTLLTIDELKDTPKGDAGQYNVIVLPGESDLSASRRDVRGTYLIIH